MNVCEQYLTIGIEFCKAFWQMVEVFTQHIWQQIGAGLLNNLRSEMEDARIRSYIHPKVKKQERIKQHLTSENCSRWNPNARSSAWANTISPVYLKQINIKETKNNIRFQQVHWLSHMTQYYLAAWIISQNWVLKIYRKAYRDKVEAFTRIYMS